MNTPLQIGSVIEVRSTKVKVQVEKDMNHTTLIYKGEIINNLSVNGFIVIRKGIVDLIGKVEAEYIEDLINKVNYERDDRYNKGSILRILEIQIVGYLEGGSFESGIKHMPMIGNISYIPTKAQVESIYLNNITDKEINTSANKNKYLNLGYTLSEEMEISFPINSFLASHLGIFGNTGSGKSNTLAKIYFDLFKSVNAENMRGKSTFHLLDFNGEYAHNGVFGLQENQVNIYILNTHSNESEKIQLQVSDFYNSEILSILFNATEQTQKPFINRLLKRLQRAEDNSWDLSNWLPFLFVKSLLNSSKEVFEYVKEILEYMSLNENSEEHEAFLTKIRSIRWHTRDDYFYANNIFFSSEDDIKRVHSEALGYSYLVDWCERISNNELGWCQNFILNAKLHLVSDMLNKHAQFDHIKPLIYRIESVMKELERIIDFVERRDPPNIMNIYSFRECSKEIKKVIPLLISKVYFEEHKRLTRQEHINKSIHFIIDEAHNILSNQNNREGQAWQDYRISLFEEIIKEGRKFGAFLTISSQRPFDISPTIISQIHNYFLHRLVNEKDLLMVDNTIPTLDKISKASLPTLTSGSCIVTGVALSMPVLIQVKQLSEGNQRPSSENIDLINIWEI